MKALTLKQPWDACILRAGKRVENRSWDPPAALIGKFIAIHRGASVDTWGVAELRHAGVDLDALGFEVTGRNRLVPKPAGVVGVARILGVVHRASSGRILRVLGDRGVEDLAAGNGGWFSGLRGWVLGDVIALPRPVACLGKLNLWDLPPDVLADVIAQLEEVDETSRVRPPVVQGGDT